MDSFTLAAEHLNWHVNQPDINRLYHLDKRTLGHEDLPTGAFFLFIGRKTKKVFI